MAKHDEMVKKLQAEVEARRAALGSRPTAVLKTNGIFRYSEDSHCGADFNINTISDEAVAIKAYAFLLRQADSVASAAEQFGETSFNFLHLGYSLEDWRHDFQFRCNVLRWIKAERQLNEMAAKLESLQSEDLKAEKALADISKSLEL